MDKENFAPGEKEMREVFARRLKLLRNENKLTLVEFVSKMFEKFGIEVSYQNIGNYERAYRMPSAFLLSKIAEFFDVSPDFLLNKTDERNVKIIQTTLFDDKNVEHVIKVGIDKNDSLSDMTFGDVRKLLEKSGYILNIDPQTKVN